MAVGFAHGFFCALMWMAWKDGLEVRKTACSKALRVFVLVVRMALERPSERVLRGCEGGGCQAA